MTSINKEGMNYLIYFGRMEKILFEMRGKQEISGD